MVRARGVPEDLNAIFREIVTIRRPNIRQPLPRYARVHKSA